MDWGELALFALWLSAPIGFAILVGETYRVLLRDELAEAKRLADKTYLELDNARFEMEELQNALDRACACGDPATDQLPAIPQPPPLTGRHRLREER